LSPPRGPDCWVSIRRPCPMNIVFHDPKWVMIIGMGQAGAFSEVPDARFMRNMLAGVMSTMFMPEVAVPVAERSRSVLPEGTELA